MVGVLLEVDDVAAVSGDERRHGSDDAAAVGTGDEQHGIGHRSTLGWQDAPVRSRPALIVAVALAAGLVPSVAVGTSEPPGGASFEIPQERWDALDDAGLGWMFSGDGYPAQPAGVPWPTEEWPVGELPAGFDSAYIDEFLTWALAPAGG